MGAALHFLSPAFAGSILVRRFTRLKAGCQVLSPGFAGWINRNRRATKQSRRHPSPQQKVCEKCGLNPLRHSRGSSHPLGERLPAARGRPRLQCGLMSATTGPARQPHVSSMPVQLSPQTIGGTPITIMVYVPDVDARFHAAIDGGATERRPLEDQFYGDRSGMVADPFGHTWMIVTHFEYVTPEEMGKRMAGMGQ